MRSLRSFAICMSTLFTTSIASSAPAGAIAWRELPDLPRALGGQFVGTIGDTLVVAGGSYFDTPPWSGGKKMWVDEIYTLQRGASAWKLAGHLPTPLGYGVSISEGNAMLAIGGQTGSATSAQTLRLTLRNSRVETQEFAPLPKANSMFAGALLEKQIYLAGGQREASSLRALNDFLFLSGSAWQPLPSWPGASRILPLMAALDGYVYLISGAELTGEAGPPVGRRFLRDFFRYKPGAGWETLPGLESAVQAGVAIAWGKKILVFGGNDGALADREFELKDKHPGFRKDVLAFDPQTLKWSKAGEMPFSLVTTGIAAWGKEWVIAGGEARPAHRSAKVIAGHFQ
jgi:N-acetylneuraminate epimerase